MFDVKWYSLLTALLVFRRNVNDYSKFQELFNVVITLKAFNRDPRNTWLSALCFQYKVGVQEFNTMYVYSALHRLYFNVGNHYDLDVLRGAIRRGSIVVE